MARNTFISYKYSESVDLRDEIIKSLGKDGKYYKGEKGFSSDLSSYSSSYIKEYLSDMIYGTSVTIVILSPNMLKSDWMDWEIKYSLRITSRAGRKSRPNGIVCVIKKDICRGYNWFKNYYGYNSKLLFSILRKNTDNLLYSYRNTPTFWNLGNDYISIVTEEEFLKDPSQYIEEAHFKAEHYDCYDLVKKTYNKYF